MNRYLYAISICALFAGNFFLVASVPDSFLANNEPSSAFLSIIPEASAASQKAKPKIVSLGGALTEIIVAMGHEKQIVGVDTTSVFPPDTVSKFTKVGYFRRLSAEGILSLEPTLIIAEEGAGPSTTIEKLKRTGVKFEIIAKNNSVKGAKAQISQLGNLLGKEQTAKTLNQEIDKKVAEAKKISAKFTRKPRVLFVYARGSRVLNVAGKNTSAHAMINLAGAENAFSDVEGFKPMTSEAVIAAKPDVILMLSRGVESIGGDDKVLALPGISFTPAGKNKKYVVMDDLKLLGFGPRLGEAVLELTKQLQN